MTTAKPMGPEPSFAIVPHTFKEEFRMEEKVKTDQYWLQMSRFSYRKRHGHVMNILRYKRRQFVAMYLGHCGLRYQIHKMGIRNEEKCRFCDHAMKSPDHLLLEWSAIARRERRVTNLHSLKGVVRLPLCA